MGYVVQATIVFGILFYLVVATINIIYSGKAARNIAKTAKAYRILWGNIERLNESLHELNQALTTVIRFTEMAPHNRDWRQNDADDKDEDWSIPIESKRFAMEEKAPGESE